MLNPKQVQRKKSQNLINLKEHQKDLDIDLKRKKSLSNLVVLSKTKKQHNADKEEKPIKKLKQQKQKKLVHSLSRGKINKRHHKSEKNDQNFNSMNHKRSIEKFNTVGKTSKQLLRNEKNVDDINHEKKKEKIKHTQPEHNLKKVSSEVKIITMKKGLKKKPELKETIEQRYFAKNDDKQKFHEEKQKHTSSYAPKTLSRNPTSKKTILPLKSKLKKPVPVTQSQVRKSTRQKLKPNSKIAQIIQKSILYSDVNYDFKQQISLLGSGIKREEDFFIPYPFQSSQVQLHFQSKESGERAQVEHKAVITIQKHFRGYIQRKYIEQARYIIDCIKKIQRFWRVCLQKKRLNRMKKCKQIKHVDNMRGEIQNSLITVKDLNEDTCRMEQRIEASFADDGKANFMSNASNQQVNKNTLKDIIRNLLSEQSLNEAIKEKIRSAMGNQHKTTKGKSQQPKLEQFTHPSTKSTDQAKNLRPKLTKSSLSQLSLDPDPTIDQHTKQCYVKKKISTQINSQRNFNSPMNSLTKQFLTSPSVKKLTSPKCLSSSFSKEVKSNYTNYFKSAKNGGMFASPNGKEDGQAKVLRSHSGSKRSRSREKEGNFDGGVESQEQLHTAVVTVSSPFDHHQAYQFINRPSQSLTLTKQDYLFTTNIDSSSPIIQCKQTSQSVNDDDINLLSTQKISLSELQTRRAMRSPVKQLRPFPTEFCFIEEFCLLITDYLREDDDTTEIFLQKVRGLKFFRIQKVFKEWQGIEFEEYWCQNQPLRAMILNQQHERPTIFSKTQKNLLLQYPSLRLFLCQNDYTEEQLSSPHHPKSSYITFMFDVFQECIYENYSNIIDVKQLSIIENKEKKRNSSDFMSVILSQAMGNMLKSAQLLCGSFESEDMTEVEKEERQVMNDMRLGEMVKEFREKQFDCRSCEMWIGMLIGKMVFEEMVDEVVEEMGMMNN